MKNKLAKFSFPYKTIILIFSTFLLFTPVIINAILVSMNPQIILNMPRWVGRLTLLVSTFISMIGLIYCTLGYHFQVLRGDELNLRIHLEALNIAFTTTLVSFFILIFAFINFAPTMLNWILAILAVIGIVTYVLAIQFIREKYQ